MWSSFTKDEKKLFLFLVVLLLIGAIVFPYLDSRRRVEVFTAGSEVTTSGQVVTRGGRSSGMRRSTPPDSPLDLNEATQEELETLPGIGKSRAAAIIRYREAHGRFRSVNDLAKVSGIGKKIAEQASAFVVVQNENSEGETSPIAKQRLGGGVFVPLGIESEQRQDSPPPTERTSSASMAPATPSVTQEIGVVDINSASENELAALEQIGPVLARRIVQYRDEHGRFRSVDELDRVPGIGKKRIELNRHRLVVK